MVVCWCHACWWRASWFGLYSPVLLWKVAFFFGCEQVFHVGSNTFQCQTICDCVFRYKPDRQQGQRHQLDDEQYCCRLRTHHPTPHHCQPSEHQSSGQCLAVRFLFSVFSVIFLFVFFLSVYVCSFSSPFTCMFCRNCNPFLDSFKWYARRQ